MIGFVCVKIICYQGLLEKFSARVAITYVLCGVDLALQFEDGERQTYRETNKCRGR